MDPSRATVGFQRALSFRQEYRTRQTDFLVNLLIALSSAIIAIVPVIINAAGNELDDLADRLYVLIAFAASSIIMGVVTSIIRLLEGRSGLWAILEGRENWKGKSIEVDKERQEKLRNIWATLFWPPFILQTVLWLAAAVVLVLTLIGLVSSLSSGVSSA